LNIYGSTEVTADATCFETKLYKKEQQGHNSSSIIGKPIANAQVLILDKCGGQCPIGIIGEICVGGMGVARGYRNRAELTAEKFVENPYGAGRLYRTGDMGRWLADGNIEYLGRQDDQVKVRGYRIELGEVEQAMLGYPGVVRGVVTAPRRDDGRILAGYVIKAQDSDFSVEGLLTYMKGILPEYMVPAFVIELESMPLTASGKVDRKALPDPENIASLNQAYEAPRDAIELLLAGIWQDLLGVGKIGIHDNFFERGGHSLLAIRAVSAIREELDLALVVRDMFAHPTIAELADLLRNNRKGKDL